MALHMLLCGHLSSGPAVLCMHRTCREAQDEWLERQAPREVVRLTADNPRVVIGRVS